MGYLKKIMYFCTMPVLNNKLYRRFECPVKRKPHQDSQDNKFYGSPLWKRLRHLQKNRKPMCEVCEAKGVFTDCSDGNNNGIADHVIRILDGGHPYDERNLFTLCKRCHNVKSNMEGRGFFPARIASVDGYYLPENKENILKAIINKKVN